MKRRPLLAAIRLTVLGLLVVTPALARPPHAPDDQYVSFIESTPLIKDAKTGLEWERSISPTTDAWASADTYCRFTFGGRLPTVKELLTLFDEEPHEEYFGGQLVTVHIDPDAFGNRTPVDKAYWTSTPVDAQATEVWALDFGSGKMSEAGKDDALHYRCVKP